VVRFGMNMTIPAASLNAEPTAPASPVTLHWPTFEAAADEAGISRRYGGIHFRQAPASVASCSIRRGGCGAASARARDACARRASSSTATMSV
jgi:hypothetical protein